MHITDIDLKVQNRFIQVEKIKEEIFSEKLLLLLKY